MVCYALSVLSAAAVYAIRRRGDAPELRTLNLMFFGGALFGFIDHWWNGELFYSPDLAADMLLGLAIVAGITGTWAAMTYGPLLLKSRNPSV